MSQPVKFCRICGSTSITEFLNLGKQPLANAVLTKEQFHNEKFYPLRLGICQECGLVQLLDIVNPEILFENYAYFTGNSSEEWKKHFSELAAILSKDFSLSENDLVVDIGSNDGTLLKNFKTKILGIDPAKNIVKLAIENGVPTICDYFSPVIADKIALTQSRAKVILATNTFGHVNDLFTFMKGIQKLLTEDGIFVIEVPYFLETYKNVEFDTIYHEHLSYFLTNPLINLAHSFKIPVFKIEKLSTHGGSLRVYMGKNREVEPSVAKIWEEECDLGLYKSRTYSGFGDKINLIRENLINLVRTEYIQGKEICGYGHPAKASVLSNYCHLEKYIDYIIDTTPYKQGKFSPGTHISIVSPDYFHNKPTDYSLIFAWNYKDEIMKKEKEFIKNGGKFIIPIPEPKVIP